MNLNKLIVKDMLGEFGDKAVKDTKKKHDKMVQIDKRKLDLIKKVVGNFEDKITAWRTILEDRVERAKRQTFVKKNSSWSSRYKRIMYTKRSK